MRGTSRAGWTAIHIAAERAGIDRPVCGDGIEVEYREVPTAQDAHSGFWAVHFIGTNPGQRLRFVHPSKLKPSVKTERVVVQAAEVDARMDPCPERPAPELAQARRMSKAFGPR